MTRIYFRIPGKKESAVATLASVIAIASLIVQISAFAFTPAPASAFSNAWDFSTPGNYTYDATKIKMTSGQAQADRTPDWWDINYLYRKKITVTAGSTAITTSDTITLNTDAAALVSAGKMQPDQDDLRIVYWNGSTNTNIDRDYLASGLGAIAATPGNAPVNNDIRFKAQAAISASGSDSGYYLYYGNGSATAGPANLANVYRYYNDFSSAGSWVLTNGTGWSINSGVAGRLAKTATEAADRFAADTGNGFSGANNWYFETTLRRTSGTNTVSIAATASIPETSTKGYRLATFGAAANDLELWALGAKISDGNTPVDYGTFTITTGTDYRMTMRYQTGTCASGIRVSGWLDATTRHDRTSMNSNNCAGVASNWNASALMYPGVHTWNEQASYDDYKVWQYLNESIVLGSEETTYPNDDPTITPVAGQAAAFNRLDTFAETATKNGGEIKYILSNDGGTTWLYHNGSNWVASDGTYAQATTAANVNTNAGTFPAGSASFLFRAFLHSSGTQLVQLDTVTINGNRSPGSFSLASPVAGATATTLKPTLQLSSTDGDVDHLRYRIQIDSSTAFNTADLQTFDQTLSQTGWSNQNAQGATAYGSGTTASYTLQSSLQPNSLYYWRVAAIDPAGINAFSTYSAAQSFLTPVRFVFTNVTATSISDTTATITWTTPNAATSTVEYGTTTGYGATASSASSVASHSVALTGLKSGTTYHFRVSGTDTTGQSATSTDAIFSTTAIGFSAVQAATITTTSANLTWTTNVATTSRVDYGTSENLGQSATASGSSTSHSVALNALTPGTTYYYKLSGTDATNESRTSGVFSFTTLANTVITAVTATPLSSRSIRVTWTTNHPADSKVRYGKTTAYGSEVYAAALVTNHEIILTDLEPNTTYHYEALSVGNTSTNDADATFAALAAPTIVEPLNEASFIQSADIPVTGNAPSGQTVNVYLDGTLACSAVTSTSSTGTGSFACTIKQTLSFGSHALTVRGSVDGNLSVPSAERTVTITTPSVAPTLLPPIITDGGPPTVTIRGLARSGDRVQVLVDGKVVGTTNASQSANGTGSFAVTLKTAGLKEGSHRVTVVSFNADDRPSRAKTAVTFSVKSGTVRTSSAKGLLHIVLGGESLWKIADEIYGDGKQYLRIAKANAKTYPSLAGNPSLILPGWQLTIPR